MSKASEALDRVEALLVEWGHAPRRTHLGVSLTSQAGTTIISAVAPEMSGSFLTVELVLYARTIIPPQAAMYFLQMAPVLNRFAVFGAITQEADCVSVLSRVSLFGTPETQENQFVLIGAASVWAAQALHEVVRAAATGDTSRPPAVESESAWCERDFAALASRLNDDQLLVVNVEHNALSVAFESSGKRVLIQAFSDTPHPALGPGLLVGLEITSETTSQSHLETLVTALNREEAFARPNFDHLGAWCLGRSDESLGYVTFVPNFLKDALAYGSMAQLFVFNAISRGTIMSEYLPILEAKLSNSN